MRTRNEIELDAVEQEMARKATEIQEIWGKADEEERGSTPEETSDVDRLYKHIENTLKPRKRELEDSIAVEREVKRVSQEMGRDERKNNGGLEFRQDVQVVPGGHPIDRMVKSLGQQFTESEGFKSVHSRLQTGWTPFSTGSIEIKAGTLTEAATLGAGLIPVPQVIPGVVSTLFQRTTIEDLIDAGQATTNSVRYIVEGTATSGAAGVAEGAAKPASALGTSTADEPIKKIATTLVVTDEMMDDVAQVTSYVNGRLSLFVQNRVETSLLGGAGTNDLVGLLDSARGINSVTKAATDNGADALFKAMNGQRGSALLEPDWILINPAAWQSIRLLRDQTGGTVGAYLGGGPFAGPYGVGPQTGLSNQVVGPADYMWGKPVYVTSALLGGSALIGTRAGAQVFSRGGLSVEASNSGYVNGSDLFTSNLVAIRAERRLGLCVYRSSAFTKVTGLS